MIASSHIRKYSKMFCTERKLQALAKSWFSLGFIGLACLLTQSPGFSQAKGRSGLQPMGLLTAIDTLNRTQPDCLVPGETQLLQPPIKKVEAIHAICIVNNSLTMTEDGGRATIIYSSLYNREPLGDHLFHIQVHTEINCKAMERRHDNDWYMNRYLLLPKSTRLDPTFEKDVAKFSADGGTEWIYGTYPEPENTWSEWTSIIGRLTVPEKFICQSWRKLASERFSSL